MKEVHDQDLFQIGDQLSIKDSSLVTHSFFESWLKDVLNYFAPINVSHIVHTGEEGCGSEKMALAVQQHYKDSISKVVESSQCQPGLHKPEIISSANIKSIYDAEDKRGVVIVSECVSDGGNELLSISRDLRNFSPTSPRSYFIGMLFSSTHNDLEILKPSLIYSPNRMKYNFNSFWEVTTGNINEPGSWKMEADLLKNNFFENLSHIQKRLNFLRNRKRNGLGEECFWETIEGKKLKLRKDFVFWERGYSCKDVKSSSVFITIATVLQNLRDGKNIPFQDKLFSNEYQSSLISPECFNRFNDGIIQASLLRAAMPRELDYSICTVMSQSMKDIFLRILNGALSDYGEAFPEFLISWVTDRLRFTEDDNQKIYSAIQDSELPEDFKLLAKFFIESKN